LAEMLAIAKAPRSHMRISIVRFTHVIEGSLVLSRFQRQIDQGCPVTVVHPDKKPDGPDPATPSKVASIFQNVGEAVDLALEAGSCGIQGQGRVFALRDFGQGVQIQEIAEDMIRRSGKNAKIQFIPPRPGDIVREGGSPTFALFNGKEVNRATHMGPLDMTLGHAIDGEALMAEVARFEKAVDKLPDDNIKERLRRILNSFEESEASLDTVVSEVHEDERDPRVRIIKRHLEFPHDAMKQRFAGRSVLITGASGNVGQALCERLIKFGVRAIYLVDLNENTLKDVSQQLKIIVQKEGKQTSIHTLLANLQDLVQVNRIFQQFQPEFVFHAAAYKLQPIIQENPSEAAVNNLLGTWNILRAVRGCPSVKCFVYVSTDKAAEPGAIYDLTKRIGEIMTKSFLADTGLRRGIVRFGNVLEKSPVIDLFEEQAAKGVLVTVTDREATRYFMRRDEATSLILTAGTLGHEGEVFVLDMGEPISILALAKAIIEDTGRKPEEGVSYHLIGPRPLEKKHELLFSPEEQHHLGDKVGDVFVLGSYRQHIAEHTLVDTIEPLINRIHHAPDHAQQISEGLKAIVALEHSMPLRPRAKRQ